MKQVFQQAENKGQVFYAMRLYGDNESLATPVNDPVTYRIKIINNTIHHTTGSAIWLANKSREITIRNNIIWQRDADRGCIRVDPGNEAGFQSDFNLLYHPSRPPVRWLDKEYSLAKFSKRTGHDKHSLSVDPLFQNVAAFDFQLKSPSPAIDAGDASGAPENDGDRKPRRIGRSVDIGAYEWSGKK